MSAILNGAMIAMRTGFETVDTLQAIGDISRKNQLTPYAKCLTSGSAVLSTICELGALALGVPVKVVQTIKEVEHAVRILAFPVALVETYNDFEETRDMSLVKGVVTPLLGILRSSVELDGYAKKTALLASATTVDAKANQSISSSSSEISLNVAEAFCKLNNHVFDCDNVLHRQAYDARDNLRAQVHALATVNALLEGEIGELEQQVAGAGNHAADDDANPVVAAPAQAAVVDIDPFDLRSLPRIPVHLHHDQLFRQYICPITNAPIRHVVCDPNRQDHIYERDAIEAWLRVEGQEFSPMTRVPLTIDQLLQKPALQAAIEERLMFYEQQLRQNANAQNTVVSNQALQDEAHTENQNPAMPPL